jgi:hypothetical protein
VVDVQSSCKESRATFNIAVFASFGSEKHSAGKYSAKNLAGSIGVNIWRKVFGDKIWRESIWRQKFGGKKVATLRPCLR